MNKQEILVRRHFVKQLAAASTAAATAAAAVAAAASELRRPSAAIVLTPAATRQDARKERCRDPRPRLHQVLRWRQRAPRLGER